jgi:ribonuclease-3
MLLEQALTHPSHPKSGKSGRSNERLEYLGDAILNYVVALSLFKRFKEEGAGFLSNARSLLVRRETLTEIAKAIDLPRHVLFCGTEESLRESKVLSNILEALVGAIFLDGGIKRAQSFVRRLFLPYMARDRLERKDPKNVLQEFCQREWKVLPRYRVRRRKEGFVAFVSAAGHKAEGRGRTKKEAEEDAARRLYLAIKEKTNGGAALLAPPRM